MRPPTNTVHTLSIRPSKHLQTLYTHPPTNTVHTTNYKHSPDDHPQTLSTRPFTNTVSTQPPTKTVHKIPTDSCWTTDSSKQGTTFSRGHVRCKPNNGHGPYMCSCTALVCQRTYMTVHILNITFVQQPHSVTQFGANVLWYSETSTPASTGLWTRCVWGKAR